MADINADPCYTYGRTALQAAAEGGHLAVVERLIQEKADINAKPATISGRTALQAAIYNGHNGVVQILSAAGAVDI
jgi:ankyrin repeat protein